MFSVSSSMRHLGSARLTLRALSIWPSEGGLARRSRNPSRADEDTNACMTSLSMRRSDFNRNPWRTRPGIPSSVSLTDRRLWPGSRKTGLTLWQESRAKAGISRKEFCFHKGADETHWGNRPLTYWWHRQVRRARSLDRDYADAVERQLRQHNPVRRTQKGHLQNRQDPLSKVVAQRVDCRASGALRPVRSDVVVIASARPVSMEYPYTTPAIKLSH